MPTRAPALVAVVALAAACSEGSTPPEPKKEPALSVETSVTTRREAPAVCTITWKAAASKPGVVVKYSVGLRGYSVDSFGEFRDSTTAEWQWGGPWPVDVAWALTSGAWSDYGSGNVSGC